MNKFMLSLAAATALAGVAAPAMADKTDKFVTDAYREKIAVARAEPGVAEYGQVYLDRASDRIAKLDKKLDNDKSGQAEAVAGEIDALLATARARARIAMLKQDVDQAKAQAAAKTNDKLASAEASAASAQADAASARAEAEKLKSEMRDYQLKQTQLGATLVLQDVVFETGKADLKAGSAQRLQPLAQYLQANPEVKVRIDGHTDSQGADAYNQQLSEARAQAVRTALGGMGVAPDRITAVGHGESQPVADNKIDAGRQQNRRVEVTLVGQQAASFAALK
ncbi:OmpA family protein [Sphingomonas sp. SRS2]|uniref:OmpA family protein n=1 Tax=Sphingomonas sp. SRS2 TaxID=133190 RepID=UPI000696A372|nr:OmpA family protein [Sphingomonas sp. SRS2]